MGETVDPLLRDLLIWLGDEGRPYADVMDAWRTSCPRLPVWEEANERGLVLREGCGSKVQVTITEAGRSFLAAYSVH